jgi:hypothetical protein
MGDAVTRTAMRLTQRAMLAAAVFAGVVVIPPLAFGARYLGIDHGRDELAAICSIQRHLLADGTLPWLTPFFGNGGPLIARPEAMTLYPLQLAVVLLQPDLAGSLWLVMHTLLAAAGATWLARTFRVRPVAAFGAGVAYALSGALLDAYGHVMYLAGAAWLPWIWAAGRRALDAKAPRTSTAVLAFAVAMELLAMEPQTLGLALGLVFFEAVQRRRAWRRAAFVALACMGAVLLGAVPWWPALAEMALTPRAGTLSLEAAMGWSLEPSTWPALFWPGVVDEVYDGDQTLWKVLRGSADLPWNPRPYIGFVLVGLACASTTRRSARMSLAWALMFAVAMLGSSTPIFPLVAELVPPFRLFRYPAKYAVPFTLALTLCAAHGLHALRAARARRRFATSMLVLVAMSATAFVVVTMASNAPPGLVDVLRKGALLSAAPALLAVACLAPRAWRARAPAFVAGVLVLDVAMASSTALDAGPSIIDAESIAGLIPPASPPPVLCVGSQVDRVALTPAQDASPVWLGALAGRQWLVNDYQACDGIAAPAPYSSLRTRIHGAVLGALDVNVSRALGCSYAVLAPGDNRRGYAPVTAMTESFDEGPTLFRVPDPLPVAFVAVGATLARSEEEVLSRMRSASDARTASKIIDDPLHRRSSDVVLPDGAAARIEDVQWPVRERATLTLSGEGGAVVALRTAFLVGWTARQGGVALPAVRATGQHLAVVVDDVTRGPVELAYESPRFIVSIVSACCGVIAMVAGVLLARPARARRR